MSLEDKRCSILNYSCFKCELLGMLVVQSHPDIVAIFSCLVRMVLFVLLYYQNNCNCKISCMFDLRCIMIKDVRKV